MKSKIICLVLSLVFLLGIFGVNGTFAWFIDYEGIGEGVSSLHNFKSGNIDYVVSEGGLKTLSAGERIQPEKELLAAPLTLINRSSVDTQLRIKVYYTYFKADSSSASGYVKSDNHSLVGETAPFVADIDENYWKYNLYDDCFYYETAETSIISAMTNEEAPQTIPLFTSMRYSGENSILPTTAFKDDNVFKITLVFQAKQANYVEWEDIGEIQFTTDDTASEGQ